MTFYNHIVCHTIKPSCICSMKGLKIPKGGNQNRMKSMKIPKGGNQNPYIEDNAMAKRKSTKGQTTIYKTYI